MTGRRSVERRTATAFTGATRVLPQAAALIYGKKFAAKRSAGPASI